MRLTRTDEQQDLLEEFTFNYSDAYDTRLLELSEKLAAEHEHGTPENHLEVLQYSVLAALGAELMELYDAHSGDSHELDEAVKATVNRYARENSYLGLGGAFGDVLKRHILAGYREGDAP